MTDRWPQTIQGLLLQPPQKSECLHCVLLEVFCNASAMKSLISLNSHVRARPKCSKDNGLGSNKGIVAPDPPYLQGAHGVVVSHPLRMRKALGSIPSVSIVLRKYRLPRRTHQQSFPTHNIPKCQRLTRAGSLCPISPPFYVPHRGEALQSQVLIIRTCEPVCDSESKYRAHQAKHSSVPRSLRSRRRG